MGVAAGLVVPDLPIKEAAPWGHRAEDVEFDLIRLVALTTGPVRARRIAKRSSGFRYAESLMGVTGLRGRLNMEARNFLRRLRALTSKPIYVGLGSRSQNMSHR